MKDCDKLFKNCEKADALWKEHKRLARKKRGEEFKRRAGK